jgi:uncharacterized protein YoxC
MPSTEMTLTILVAVIAVGGLIQLIILFAVFLVFRKGMKVAGEYATEMQSHIVPLLEQSRTLFKTTNEIIGRLEPKLETAATDLAEMAHIAKTEARKMQESADEIAERVRRQAARVDGMTTDVLNGIDRAGQLVSQAVTVPLRQISGIAAAAKAIIETFRAPAPRGRARS